MVHRSSFQELSVNVLFFNIYNSSFLVSKRLTTYVLDLTNVTFTHLYTNDTPITAFKHILLTSFTIYTRERIGGHKLRIKRDGESETENRHV